MKMHKIFLIDYNCVTDNNGLPVGHTLGMAEKLINLLKNDYELTYVCSEEYASAINGIEIMPILKSIAKGTDDENNTKKIVRNNFVLISRACKEGILFFIHFNTIYSTYLPKKTRKRKTICICFNNIRRVKTGDSIFKAIARRFYFFIKNFYLKKRINVLIKTNKKLNFTVKNILYMPDYYYIPEFYSRYATVKDKNLVVCLGQNNRYKQIIPLIQKFGGSKYTLLITGKFFQTEFFENAVDCAAEYDNIFIKNDNISSDEYYSILAEASYCVVPYDSDFYYERTTGVAIEAMFSDTVVIGPKSILDFNDIDGICYDKLENLDLCALDASHEDILRTYDEKRKGEYSLKFTEKILRDAVKMALEEK